MENTFKLCILAAGLGTRIKSYPNLHKGLLPLGNRPVISWILDSVPDNIEIVIATGHLSNQLRNYLKYIYPTRKFTFVEVDNYSKMGSGPGYSLLQCRRHLQCPFIFTSVDTVVDSPGFMHSSPEYDWVGVAEPDDSKRGVYEMVVKQEDNSIIFSRSTGNMAFTGIAGVKNYKKFWSRLATANSTEVIAGINLLSKPWEMKWLDTGNEISYSAARDVYKDIVPRKPNQALFIDNGKVVKFFSNPEVASKMYKRGSIIPFTPDTDQVDQNMIGYTYIEGKLLSEILDTSLVHAIIIEILSALSNHHVLEAPVDQEELYVNCHLMYRVKTYSRIKPFIGSRLDKLTSINGVKVTTVEEMMSKIDWNSINSAATPCICHGDLQPENIIVDLAEDDDGLSVKKIYLIDWREGFGDSLLVGDIRYELTKLSHATLITGKAVNEDRFSMEIGSNFANIAIDVPSNMASLHRKIYREREYSSVGSRSRMNQGVLLGLQYLSIASLYLEEKPKYASFLFLLGKYILQISMTTKEGQIWEHLI